MYESSSSLWFEHYRKDMHDERANDVDPSDLRTGEISSHVVYSCV